MLWIFFPQSVACFFFHLLMVSFEVQNVWRPTYLYLITCAFDVVSKTLPNPRSLFHIIFTIEETGLMWPRRHLSARLCSCVRYCPYMTFLSTHCYQSRIQVKSDTGPGFLQAENFYRKHSHLEWLKFTQKNQMCLLENCLLVSSVHLWDKGKKNAWNTVFLPGSLNEVIQVYF